MRYRVIPSNTKSAIDIGRLIGFDRVNAGCWNSPVYVRIEDNEIEDVREILNEYQFITE